MSPAEGLLNMLKLGLFRFDQLADNRQLLGDKWENFYPGKAYVARYLKDVGNDSTYPYYVLSMGTLVK